MSSSAPAGGSSGPSPVLAAAIPPTPTRRLSTKSARSYLETSGAPASSVHDLPSAQAMADLELIRSSSRTSSKTPFEYRGGGGLSASASRGSRKNGAGAGAVVGREGKIEEGVEGVDEEIAVGEHGEVIDETEERAVAMYAKFSKRRKGLIVAIVAYCALLAPFSSSSFLPSIPAIAKDLNTTATILDVTVAIYIVVLAICPLAWAPYAGVYGRRPIYLLSLPIFAFGSLGVALSPTLTALIITRVIQGAGSSAVLSVGAGTIGDLYPRENRGKAMGFFYSGILVGPALAPVIAGILTEYVQPRGTGWRAMQYLLFAMGLLASLLVVMFLPETAHSRGIDLIREERRSRHREMHTKDDYNSTLVNDNGASWWTRWTRDLVFVWLNPLAPLKMLWHPHILAMSLNSSFVLMSTYTVLVPLGETLAPRYNITNTALLGCFYLAQGLGNAVAAQFTGRYADWTLRRWLRIRGGVYVPEDRLRAALWGGGTLLPLSVVALGWVLDRASGKGGLAASVVLLFLDGMGLMMVLTPCNTYCVDVMQHRSAEVIAVNNCVRYLFSAGASAFVLPMIQRIGVGWTNTFAAGLCWIGFGFVALCIRYGERMRALGARWEGHEGEGEGIDGGAEGAEKEQEEKQKGDQVKPSPRGAYGRE